MTNTFNGRFDGRVIVPQGPVNLPSNEDLIVHVQLKVARPRATPGADLMSLAGSISSEDAHAMMDRIEEGCERVEPDAK